MQMHMSRRKKQTFETEKKNGKTGELGSGSQEMLYHGLKTIQQDSHASIIACIKRTHTHIHAAMHGHTWVGEVFQVVDKY